MFSAQILASMLVAWFIISSNAAEFPTVADVRHNIIYHGIYRNGIEAFLGIRYGEDTGGASRFKPPVPHVPETGSTIYAQVYGPACPQQLGKWMPPLSLSNITDVSEDCLKLNVARPAGSQPHSRLPVMIYIHGGSFWSGQSQEITIRPDGMVLESIQNGLPIIHVAINYRLGAFGFSQSEALKSEKSENAGLRDQRLAIEWVRDNIAQFGGDPDKITIFGQSSGGLSVGMQILAYGGTRPAPFHQAICQSGALEPGITGNFTLDAMLALVNYVGCNSSALHSKETLKCLRSLDTTTLLSASLETYQNDISHNIGDIWLPVIDDDFLPAAPSQLVIEGRFSDVTTMIGWCEDDLTFFTDTEIETPDDTFNFTVSYVPNVSRENIQALLSLYPASEFFENEPARLSREFYRSARIFRDICMTCQSVWFGEHIASAGNTVYLYDWNQTILEPALASITQRAGYGSIHTSEFAYIFGNLSHYNQDTYSFSPTRADFALQSRGSRSWSTFAATGAPGLLGHDTFQGFHPILSATKALYLFVVGGPHEGVSAFTGPHAHMDIQKQRLRERCAFLNTPEMIQQLGF